MHFKSWTMFVLMLALSCGGCAQNPHKPAAATADSSGVILLPRWEEQRSGTTRVFSLLSVGGHELGGRGEPVRLEPGYHWIKAMIEKHSGSQRNDRTIITYEISLPVHLNKGGRYRLGGRDNLRKVSAKGAGGRYYKVVGSWQPQFIRIN